MAAVVEGQARDGRSGIHVRRGVRLLEHS